MGDCVLEFLAADVGVEIQKDGGVGGKVPDEAIDARLDERIHLGVEEGVGGEIGERPAGILMEIGFLPVLEGAGERCSTRKKVAGEDEAFEVIVGEGDSGVVESFPN